MFIEIIKHTPPWVFVLFFVLLILGYLQTKNRKVKLNVVFILPVSMITLSIFGVSSAFGLMPMAFASWFIGGIFSLGVSLKIVLPKSINYSSAEEKFFIPGSWVPLFLMMAIFSTKYIVGVAIARQLPIISEVEFITFISLLYGCFSGIFLSRSIIVWQTRGALS